MLSFINNEPYHKLLKSIPTPVVDKYSDKNEHVSVYKIQVFNSTDYVYEGLKRTFQSIFPPKIGCQLKIINDLFECHSNESMAESLQERQSNELEALKVSFWHMISFPYDHVNNKVLS